MTISTYEIHLTPSAIQANTPSELITIDQDYLSRISLRRDLIAHHGATVHGLVPSGEPAVRELYAYLLTDYLPARFPSLFSLSRDKALFVNSVTGKSFPTAAPPDATAALRILGETVEEDFFLLREGPGGHESVAFVCCFPAGFDPSEKLGRSLAEIHGPVPAYERIGASMERFFARLEVGKSVKRTNVSFWGFLFVE